MRRCGAALLCLTTLFACAEPAGARWHPRRTTSPWQIQLSGRADTTVRALVYELDCDGTPRSVVKRLRAKGVRVLGYIDAGSWESYRSDAADFPPEVIGKPYPGYPDERWLDIRRADVIVPLIRRRMQVCAGKGFDGVDPDNVNGYENDTGFALSAADQVRFDTAIAAAAHTLGLAVTLKNTGGLTRRLHAHFDGAVVESCFRYRECGAYGVFTGSGKPVYAIEYGPRSAAFCAQAGRRGFSLIFKQPALGARRRTC